MFLPVAVLAVLPSLVPARWASNDPATLDLVRMTPVNCILVEQPQWSKPFNEEAAKRGLTTLAVIHPQSDAVPAATKAMGLRFDGAVLEGNFEAAQRSALLDLLSAKSVPVIEIGLRSQMKFDGVAPVIGTYQGVWPGIQVEEDGKAKAAPSGAAWIDTNTGFLRFVAASTSSTMWIANQPPKGLTYSPERYMQAVADAAMTGARWVISLDDSFTSKLLDRDPKTLDGWRNRTRTGDPPNPSPVWLWWRIPIAEPFFREAFST